MMPVVSRLLSSIAGVTGPMNLFHIVCNGERTGKGFETSGPDLPDEGSYFEDENGTEKWLNWVVRLNSGELAGYVQATVVANGRCYFGYEFASRFWRRGIATSALQAMFAELARHYGVRELIAVLKVANFRSKGLLRKLGFVEVPTQAQSQFEPEEGETVMLASCSAHGT